MKNAALSGKPYAGNPHVRFDEGEVASAKPRRGSLLYKIYPKVSDRISVPKGMPNGTLFVEVTKSAKVIDGITKRHPNLEDRARGYWTVPNLKAAHANLCDWLVAREHGKIVGVWKIDRTKGWMDPTQTPKKTWPTDNGGDTPRLGCELVVTDEFNHLIGQRVHLGRCPNSLRSWFN